MLTFDQVTLDDTYEMHDQTNAPLELLPSQVVVWDPESFVSANVNKRTKQNLLMERPKLLNKKIY